MHRISTAWREAFSQYGSGSPAAANMLHASALVDPNARSTNHLYLDNMQKKI
jgi:hypothetical protein